MTSSADDISGKQPQGKAWMAAYAEKWFALTRKRAGVDYQIAGLAHEIREQFPRGGSGDFQFRRWCMDWLYVAPATADMLLRAVKAHRVFSEKEWYLFGGRLAVQFLVSLKKPGRDRVVRACREELEERGGQPICYSYVKNVAYALGVVQDRVRGRPNRTRVEENVGVLREFLIELYRDYGSALPDLPAHVEKAMGETKLAQWRREAAEMYDKSEPVY